MTINQIITGTSELIVNGTMFKIFGGIYLFIIAIYIVNTVYNFCSDSGPNNGLLSKLMDKAVYLVCLAIMMTMVVLVPYIVLTTG